MGTALKKGLISVQLSWILIIDMYLQEDRFRKSERERSTVMQAHSRFWFVLLAFAVLLLSTATTVAENVRVGIAATVKEDVTGVIGSEPPRQVVVGEDVFFDERVLTTTNSSAVVQFRDRSTLEIGPDSVVVLDRSVFDPAESVSTKSMTVVSAVFRFISGVGTKTSETDIRTPTGVIGIRGSVAIGMVSPNGDVVILLPQGKADWTGPAGTKIVPQGGALIATYATGQTLIMDQVPPSFAGIIQKIMLQLGSKPPPKQPLTPAQKDANAKDHLVSASQQNDLQQPVNPNPVIHPLSDTSQSEIANLLLIIQNPQLPGGPGGQGQGGLTADDIRGILNAQALLHHANVVDGVVGVTEELSTVLTSEEALRIARELSALSPEDATEIMAQLDSLGFPILAFAPPIGPTLYAGGSPFGTFGTSTTTGAGSSVSK